MTWTDRKCLGDLIKSIVFDQKLLDPKDYDKQRIIALKKSVSIFSAVDEDLFFTAFRRSASEYLLLKDLDTVELRRANQASSTPAPPQTNQVSTPAAPPQTANQVPSAPAPPKIRKQVDKPNTMPSSSVHALLHVVSSWVDKKQSDRVHVVISMPSGTHLLKKAEVVSTDSGSHLSVLWHWPQIMLDPVKMFAHSRFHGTIQANHPKVIAFVGETDKIRAAANKVAGNNGRPTSQMIIKFPPGEYQYIPEKISGHPSVNLFSYSTDNIGSAHTTIFCLFDLMLKKLDDESSFSMKAVLVDDNECD
jgi:hypothetical protein